MNKWLHIFTYQSSNINSFSNRCRYLLFINSSSEFIISIKSISWTLFCICLAVTVSFERTRSPMYGLLCQCDVFSFRFDNKTNLIFDWNVTMEYFHLIFFPFWILHDFASFLLLLLLFYVLLLWSVCCCIIFAAFGFFLLLLVEMKKWGQPIQTKIRKRHAFHLEIK